MTLNAASADRNKLIAQQEYRGMSYPRTRSGSQYKPADMEVGNYYFQIGIARYYRRMAETMAKIQWPS